MKKSFFVGFLATLGLAETDWRAPSYKSQHTSEVVISEPSYPRVNTNLFPVSGSSSQSYNSAVDGAIRNAENNFSYENRSIDSLFTQLPSLQQLDRLILNADTVAILKTIQTVATNDSLTCDQRVAYLLEVLGRIRTAIEAKQFSADQLKVIIDGANGEIVRLENEIKRLEGQIKNLWLEELRDQLAKAVAELETLYKRFNAVEREIAPKEAEVEGLKQEVKIINAASDAERNRINNDRLKLTEAQARIRDLENRLAAAREQRAAVLANIANSESIIAKNNKEIDDARRNIAALEAEVDKLTDQADSLRIKYNDLEIEVERLRTEISIAETKAQNYRDDIAALQMRIDNERSRIRQPELDNLNEMIATLQRMIPSVQSEIDRHYYYCYGEGVKEERNQSVVVYIVQGERFGDYLHSQYGTNVRVPNVRGDVQLQRVNILGKTWVEKHGYPFSESSLGGNSFDIAGSFNCLTPSRSVRGSGQITDIGADYIGVRMQDGSQSRFSLGSCSRIESTSELPTIGQNIAYVAVPSSADGYNLYQASCW